MFGYAQTCPRLIFSTLFTRGSSDAANPAFGYQCAVAICVYMWPGLKQTESFQTNQVQMKNIHQLTLFATLVLF